MAKKLKISVSQTQTIREAFDDFLLQKKALGLADKTIETYSHHFGIISKYLDSSAPIAGLFKRPLDEMIERMRSAGMKDTSINSYTRTLKSFLSWCNREGLTQANITLYRCQQVVKETYTDDELMLLLKKPNLRTCAFAEYRNWVIINYLLNSGNRARTIRLIQNKDLDLCQEVREYDER